MNIIAIDGPAGSGKSTAARKLALALGFTYLNTGAMYRAVALLAQEGGFDLNDSQKVKTVAETMRFEYNEGPTGQRFHVNGADRTEALFTAALTGLLKPVVNNEEVRATLVEKMRTAAASVTRRGAKGVVLEGRDIGTVVFPDAAVKFYIHADILARTERRAKELHARGELVDFDGLRKQIQYRDDTDLGRQVGALVRAADAIDIDSTHRDEHAVLACLLEEVRRGKLGPLVPGELFA
jgi:cytidylate kinase